MFVFFQRLKDFYAKLEANSEFPKQQLPTVIQFPVNDICNSRCQMCNIWQQKIGYEISPSEIRRVLADPLFAEVLHVGINGGEPTIRKDIGLVAAAIIESLPSLKGLFLITNAIVFEKVALAIEAIGKQCEVANVKLDVMVSLDGVGEVHDRVRGRPGNFNSAVRTIEFVRNSKLVSSFRIGCTVIRENVYEVEKVLDWCIANDVYARFRIGIPHQRLYSLGFPHPTTWTEDEKFHFANFLDNLRCSYEKDASRAAFYLSLRNQLVSGSARAVGCNWKSQGVTLSSRGDLAFCAVESPVLGSALVKSSSELYWSNSQTLKDIQRGKCSGCMHDYEGTMVKGDVNRLFVQQLSRIAINRFEKLAKRTIPRGFTRLAKRFAPKAIASAIDYRRRGGNKKLRNVGSVKVSKCAAMPLHIGNLPARVLLCGWYGTETLGDKAILAGVASQLKEVSDIEIDLASIEPYISANTIRQMPELKIRSNYSLAEAKTRVRNRNYQAVIMAGGPLMSTIEQVHDIRDLFYEQRRLGGATVVAGCGVGPLGSYQTDIAIGELLKLANAVILRDQKSAIVGKHLANLAELPLVAVDPAFNWLAIQRSNCEIDKLASRDQILLALRDWPIEEYARDLDIDVAIAIKDRYESQIMDLVDYISVQSPSTVIVPFCMHKYAVGGNDRIFYRRLLSRFPHVLEMLDHRHRTPAEDFRTIAQSRAVLAMRFHSVVFSLGAGTPFEAIDYTRGGKIDGLLTDLDLRSHLNRIEDFDGIDVAQRLLSKKSVDVTWMPNLEEQEVHFRATMRRVFSSFGLGPTVSDQ